MSHSPGHRPWWTSLKCSLCLTEAHLPERFDMQTSSTWEPSTSLSTLSKCSVRYSLETAAASSPGPCYTSILDSEGTLAFSPSRHLHTVVKPPCKLSKMPSKLSSSHLSLQNAFSRPQILFVALLNFSTCSNFSTSLHTVQYFSTGLTEAVKR